METKKIIEHIHNHYPNRILHSNVLTHYQMNDPTSQSIKCPWTFLTRDSTWQRNFSSRIVSSMDNSHVDADRETQQRFDPRERLDQEQKLVVETSESGSLDDVATFVLPHQDHTIGNPLRHLLMSDPEVCGRDYINLCWWNDVLGGPVCLAPKTLRFILNTVVGGVERLYATTSHRNKNPFKSPDEKRIE